ncbi:MAG: DUF4418 family protein [Clostridia bacterium]|nr:DUF4418 family protein [Clostridia bacterium]MBR5266165.1 DUF4418 family protein [Clostridia bacterium]
MKNKTIPSIVLIIYGLLVSFGPQTLFKVCVNSTTPMKCTYAAAAEIGIGLIAVLLGVLYMTSRGGHERITLSVASIGVAIVVMLVPSVLIGGCKNPTMPCILLTYPILYALSAAAMVFLGVNVLMLAKEEKKANRN